LGTEAPTKAITGFWINGRFAQNLLVVPNDVLHPS